MNNNKRNAILLILMSAIGFAAMNLFVRLAGDIPSLQKSFFRNAVALLCAAFVVFKNRTPIRLPKGSGIYMFLRCAIGTIGIFANFYAVDHLNISDASLLNKLAPFFAIILSIFVLKEKASPRQWACIAAAFVGLMLIVRPGFNTASMLPYLVGMAGGVAAGTAYTMVRKLGTYKVAGPLIVLFFSAYSTVAAVPFIIADRAPMNGKQLLLLICAGIAASVAQFSITAAYKLAPAREISVFEYTQIIFSALLGFVFLGQVPDVLCFAGYAVIIGAAAVNTMGKSKAA